MQPKSKSTFNRQRRLLVFSLFFLLFGVLVYGTVAYFTTDQTATSLITAGNIDIKLIQKQEFSSGEYFVPFDNITDLMPGQSVSRVTSVENVGGYDAYIRVDVELLLILNEGYSISVAPDNPVHIDFNTTDWTYKDGYYYYNEILPYGEATAPLFTTVSFSKDIDNSLMNSTANLKVKAYATQVANNGTNVFDAAGWPEDVE